MIQLPGPPKPPGTRAFELFDQGAQYMAFWFPLTNGNASFAARRGFQIARILDNATEQNRWTRTRDRLLEWTLPRIMEHLKRQTMSQYARASRRYTRKARWLYFKENLTLRCQREKML